MHGRYAPSPTGPLHLGNIRTALITWLHGKLQGGDVFLRFDDLDTPRNRPGSIAQIQSDLAWLGLDFHPGVYLQSEHLADYQAAFEKLFDRGLIYPCRCSRKDIQQMASAPDSRFSPGRYPGTCRPGCDRPQIEETENRAWRFQLEDSSVFFNDRVVGEQSDNPWQQSGDFVVKRKDGFFAYQLATVVDDGNLGITDVVRGIDLIDSTARQLALYRALEIPSPVFWHVPLMLDQNGEKLSKRDGAASLEPHRQQGKTAEDILGMLAASLGLVEENARLSAKDLLASLSLSALQTALRNPAPVEQIG